MIDIAQKSLDLCQQDERATIWFARLVLSGPGNLRYATAKLPGPVAEACWRLINLLEYLADLDAPGTIGSCLLALLAFTTAPRLLEEASGDQKPLGRPGLAEKAGYLVNLPPCPTAHSTSKI